MKKELEPKSTSTAVEEGRGWSHASLRIFGEALQPDEVGAALGIEASYVHLKGQRHGRNGPAWRESAWLLQSPLGKEHGLDEHIKWLLERIEDKVDVVRKLCGEYRIDVFCGFSSGCGQGGFTLDSKTLERIAKLGVSLALDLYPPFPSEENENAGQM